MSYWLSYGGGVNSTALAILLAHGRLPQYEPWRIVMADTGDERPETYAYIETVFGPWLERHGRRIEVVRAKETVLQRWQRIRVTGSRIIRTCSEEAKIKPIEKYIAEHVVLGQLIGIDADQPHRAKERPGKFYPLVEQGIDRDGCVEIIREGGLPIPIKSGCWHCPFMRVGQVIELAKTDPCRLAQIEKLEELATATHGPNPMTGGMRTQWGDHPVSYWRERAAQGHFFIDEKDSTEPCECYDGGNA